jgi:hypothetical protein
MILTSPSKDVDQTPPVTTTFDPTPAHRSGRPPRRSPHGRIDWGRVERLYSFVRTRALDRLTEAERCRDHVAMSNEGQAVQAIEAMFSQARHGRGVLAECAITFFRARAMRDADHPEFLGEWLGPNAMESRSA